jgi:hypothetical protein
MLRTVVRKRSFILADSIFQLELAREDAGARLYGMWAELLDGMGVSVDAFPSLSSPDISAWSGLAVALRAEVSRLAAPVGDSGWRLVPEKPDAAMLQRAQKLWNYSQSWETACDCYRAMLAAAPSAPAGGELADKAARLAGCDMTLDLLVAAGIITREKAFQCRDIFVALPLEASIVSADAALAAKG